MYFDYGTYLIPMFSDLVFEIIYYWFIRNYFLKVCDDKGMLYSYM